MKLSKLWEKSKIKNNLKKLSKSYDNFDPHLALQALNVIESLCYEDIAMNPEQKIEEIYKYAHVGLGRCSNPHEDWRKDLVDTEQCFEEIGLSKKI